MRLQGALPLREAVLMSTIPRSASLTKNIPKQRHYRSLNMTYIEAVIHFAEVVNFRRRKLTLRSETGAARSLKRYGQH
jgi:hypothetical protein